jgi:hypothetical protein
MSVEKAKEFLLALKEKGADEAWTAKAAEMKTNEEKFALAAEMAKEMGYDLTAKEIKESMEALAEEEKEPVPLDDEEVEGVAGGSREFSNYVTEYCDKCGCVTKQIYTGNVRMIIFFIYREYECEGCKTRYWY